MLRILLADDHAAVRRGLRCLLGTEPNCRVCAEAGNGEEAVRLAAVHQPDVAILDLKMPGLSGIEAAAQIRASVPACEIVILTMYDSDELSQAAFAAGARAYVLKSDAEQHLIPALRSLVVRRHAERNGTG
jgi:DNA-binding NarL/FixJ family response regulator